MGRKLLSKEKIQQTVRQCKQTLPEIEQLGEMAEAHKREVRSRQRPRKRKVKQQLKSTDYLSIEQFAEVINFVKAEADEAKVKGLHLYWAIVNEMLLIPMAETGLRASGIRNLCSRIYHHTTANLQSRSSAARDKSSGPWVSQNGFHRSLLDM